MDEQTYKASLVNKTIDEMGAEMQQLNQEIELLLTVRNSLDEKDITEGGGSPEDQARYQEILMKQRSINEEINKRHMLEMLS